MGLFGKIRKADNHASFTRELPDGRRMDYEGAHRKGDKGRVLPHGQGMLRLDNGDVFLGEFRDGIPTKGRVFNSSRAWEGEHTITENKAAACAAIYPAHGEIKYLDGRHYAGDIHSLSGKPHGLGTYTWHNEDGSVRAKFVGKWHEGTRLSGTYTFANGDIYRGLWKNEKPHDTAGSLHFAATQRQYKGSVVGGEMHGEGAISWQDESGQVTVEGSFERNELPTVGTRTYNGGTHTFIGKLGPDGTPTHEGLYTTSDTEYRGATKDLQPHGHGSMRWPQKDMTYVGQWCQGKFEGLGKLTTKTFVYDGPFRNNAMHGVDIECGVYTWKATGETVEGHFDNDAFPKAGRFTYADGEVFQGPLKEGRPLWPRAAKTAAESVPQGARKTRSAKWPFTPPSKPAAAAAQAARPKWPFTPPPAAAGAQPRAAAPAAKPAAAAAARAIARRAHLRETLAGLISANGTLMTDPRRLDCGHELDISEITRLHRDRTLQLKRVEQLKQKGRSEFAAKLERDAPLRYACPCCRAPISKDDPKELPRDAGTHEFLNRMKGALLGWETMGDEALNAAYQGLIKDNIYFPRPNNGRKA